MIRPTVKVQEDVCPSCKSRILVTNWDDMEGIQVDPYRVDPTPITVEEETVCIVVGRSTYLLEETSVRTWRLSKRGSHTGDIQPVNPIAVLPHHRCGGRHDNEISMPAQLTSVPATPPY